jgi:hypothetical protein
VEPFELHNFFQGEFGPGYKEEKTVIKRVLLASSAVVGLLGLALVVGAQGPRAREDFGPFGPGGRGSGIPACAQTKNCPTYQFTWTRKITRPVLTSATSASPVTDTTSGVLAGDQFGSTYYEVTVSPVGPWASKPGPQELIYVRDLDTMLGYIENVSKNTYEKFPIQVRTPRDGRSSPVWNGGGPGKGPGKGPNGGTGKGPTIVRKSLNGTVYGGYKCLVGEMTTITGPDTTTNRVYCSDLRILVEEDSTGPRSSSTYTLSSYSSKLSGTLPFTPSGTLVERPKFGHGGGPGGPGGRRLPPSP